MILSFRTITTAIVLVGVAAAQTQQVSQPTEWQRSEVNDAPHKASFTQFVLRGKYLVAPSNKNEGDLPALVVRCSPEPHSVGYHVFVNGRFIAGYVVPGSVVNSQVTVREGLLETSFPLVVPAEFRLDEGKLQTENWSVSTDHSAAFFGAETLNNFLYGHVVRHKEGTSDQVHRIIMGINEAFAGEVQMAFDMPDATPVAEACGVILHKK